jgi:hypothetical protein
LTKITSSSRCFYSVFSTQKTEGPFASLHDVKVEITANLIC